MKVYTMSCKECKYSQTRSYVDVKGFRRPCQHNKCLNQVERLDTYYDHENHVKYINSSTHNSYTLFEPFGMNKKFFKDEEFLI